MKNSPYSPKKQEISQSVLRNSQDRTINLNDKAITKNTYFFYEIANAVTRPLFSGKYLLEEKISDVQPSMPNALKIGNLLGKGGYGEVYEVFRISDPGKIFALKIPGPPLFITKGYILNEIHKLKILNKPGNCHIPKVAFGSFSWQGETIPYYITHVFTPVEKQFPNYEQQANIDPIVALETFYSMAQGLKYITSHNIIHNDVKPENIMFYNNFPIITDYGTARSYSEINEVEIERLQGRLHGTPTWLPPELIFVLENEDFPPSIYFNLSKLGQKTDVWGLGLILMRYLTGKSLFHDVPLKKELMPDIFYTIHHQFSQSRIISRYRQYATKLIHRIYGPEEQFEMKKKGDTLETKKKVDTDKIRKGDTLETKKKVDTDKIRKLLGDKEMLDELFNQNKEFGFKSEEAKSGRILANKFVLKKFHLLERPRSDFEINDFFLSALFDIFDMCVAPLENRIKIYQLVDILDVVFPGLTRLQKAAESLQFSELIHPGMEETER